MTRTTQLIEAKYKGVPFKVRSEVLNDVGQKRIIHRYPKTGIQYAEPMGQEPFHETIDLFFTGENFLEDFEKFKRAIQDPAPGRLYSPTFGIFNNVVALPGSFTSDQKTVGEITASITFEETIEKPSPLVADASERDVSEKAQRCRDELKDVFTEVYESPETVNNLLTAIRDAKGLANKLKAITKAVRAVRNFIRKVDRAIRSVQAYADLLLSIVNPVGLLQNITEIINSGDSAFSKFKQVVEIGTDLSNSMNDIKEGSEPFRSTLIPRTAEESSTINTIIPLWNGDTVERQNRNTQRLAITNTFRMTGLIGMFDSAASQDYTTTEDVERVKEDLENYYASFVENDTTGVVIPQMKQILDELRNLTFVVLQNKAQQSFSVTTVKVHIPTSTHLLAYKLYGEYIQNEAQLNYLADLIKGLNVQQVPYRLTGDVKVVEIGRG